MSAIQHSVLPVEEGDLPTLAQFLIASQLMQPTSRFLFLDWPNEPAQTAPYLDPMKQNFKEPATEMFKVVDNVSGDIIASLVLIRKKPDNSEGSDPTSQQTQVSSPPPGMDPEFRSILRSVLAASQKDMEGIDHLGDWCLTPFLFEHVANE